jgi:small subunit ribosomal protein S20
MANTKSAKKAVRSSAKKKAHNLSWKKRVKLALRNFTDLLKDGKSVEDLNKSLSVAQKALDKASKENVIHKNKANRIKSKLALKLKANDTKPATKKSAKSSK